MLRWVFLFLCITTSMPAFAQQWESGQTPQYGTVAALVGHPVLDSVLLMCDPSQGVRFWVHLNDEYVAPDPGQPLYITLQGHDGGESWQRIMLDPAPNRREYWTIASPELLALLVSSNRSLWFADSPDGEAFSRDAPDLPLTGSTAAIRPVIAACEPAEPEASQASGGDVASVRSALERQYQQYQRPFESRDSAANIDFSSAVNALIDRTDMGALDYDAFCQCQDYDEQRFRYQIDAVSVDGNRATAIVQVSAVGGPMDRIRIELVMENGRWVVDDVIGGEGSLRESLR